MVRFLPVLVVVTGFLISGCAGDVEEVKEVKEVKDGGGAATVTDAAPPPAVEHDHSKHDHSLMLTNEHAHHAGMKHGPKAIPAGVKVPTMLLSVYPDPMSGVNLHVSVNHFRLMPPQFASDGVDLEGHAHVYINGEKLGRLYGSDIHLPRGVFKPGENRVEVSLNSHNHEVWTSNGEPIMAYTVVKLPQSPSVSTNAAADKERDAEIPPQ